MNNNNYHNYSSYNKNKSYDNNKYNNKFKKNRYNNNKTENQMNNKNDRNDQNQDKSDNKNSEHQTYQSQFAQYVKKELKFETDQFQERLRNNSLKELEYRGLCINNVYIKKSGRFFNKIKQKIEIEKSKHEFKEGDILFISYSDPSRDKICESTVLNSFKYILEIVIDENNQFFKNEYQRIDKGWNSVTQDRMFDCLRTVLNNFDRLSNSAKFIISENYDYRDNHDNKIFDSNSKSLKIIPDSDQNQLIIENWNQSQISALTNILNNNITLIQGPPGTGKTTTAVRLMNQLMTKSSSKDNFKVLCCAYSNVATDNIMLRMMEQNDKFKQIRIGQPDRFSSHSLFPYSSFTLFENHPSKKNIDQMFDKINELNQNLRFCSGRDIGLSKRDINILKKQIDLEEKKIEDEILSKCNVVFATCIGAGMSMLDSFKFDLVLIDECTQSMEPASLIPIIKTKSDGKVVLIGDHKQLPPTVNISKELEYSMFERIMQQKKIDICLLDTQYRMHSTLNQFPNKQFYNSQIHNGVSDIKRKSILKHKNIVFLNVNGNEKFDENTKSQFNESESNICFELLREISNKSVDIGIITPQSGQKFIIKNKLLNDQNLSKLKSIEVNTVDGQQGREKEVILISLVRSNTNGNLGFLTDQRRINVAITRAKTNLIIVGNKNTIINDQMWKDQIDQIESL